MKNLLNLFLFIVILSAIFYFVFYSLNLLFIYDKTLLVTKLMYTFGFLILVVGIWVLLPKKMRIFLASFIFSMGRVKQFKYGDPLTFTPINSLGIEYFIGDYKFRIKFIGVILLLVSLIIFVYMLSLGLTPL